MHSILNVTVAFVVALVVHANPVVAQPTFKAIVVGNTGYDKAPLENALNDATLVAQTLEEVGFSVDLFHNVTSDQLPSLRERVDALADADVSVLYFAGHGLQYKGDNLLVTTDADVTNSDSIIEKSARLSDVIRRMATGSKGLRLVILDACRQDISPGGQSDFSPGFSLTEAPEGEVLIAFSTGSGELAYDGVGGDNSPYTSALANAFLRSNADVYDIFRFVRRSVRSSTGGRQIPWITGSVESEYIFRKDSPLPDIKEAEKSTAPVVTTAGETLSVDSVLWYYLRDSIDPEDFRRFQTSFPDSIFADDAGARETELTDKLIQVAELRAPSGDLSPKSIVSELAPTPSPEDEARRSVLLDQSGSYVMRPSFRTWPLELPTSTPAGIASTATSCDEEAADPFDPQKLSPGLSADTLNVRRALRACAFDLANDPNNPRLLFQFGRVLDVAGRAQWANAYYSAAAEADYSAAMVNLGFNFRRGRGVERSMENAISLYRRGAELGNMRARTNMGDVYLYGRGVDAQPEEGILWFRLAASLGWPAAVNALGDAYRQGLGTAQDQATAIELYRSAAEAGQTTAMANLGVSYLQGRGVEQDVNEGLLWIERAIELGNGFAPVYGGQFFFNGGGGVAANPERAEQLIRLGARRGNRVAYRELARGFLEGKFPGGRDTVKAYRNALFAVRARVRNAEKLRDQAATDLDETTRARISAEVEAFIRSNGI